MYFHISFVVKKKPSTPKDKIVLRFSWRKRKKKFLQCRRFQRQCLWSIEASLGRGRACVQCVDREEKAWQQLSGNNMQHATPPNGWKWDLKCRDY